MGDAAGWQAVARIMAAATEWQWTERNMTIVICRFPLSVCPGFKEKRLSMPSA